MKLKFRSKLNHEFTNHGYLHRVVWKALYNFKIKGAQEARYNQSFFQNIQNDEIFQIFKMFKTAAELTFTTQKANGCSPWTACSVFNWKYLFWVNLVQQIKLVGLSWNLVRKLIWISGIQWLCSLFLFLTRKTVFG